MKIRTWVVDGMIKGYMTSTRKVNSWIERLLGGLMGPEMDV